MPDYADTHSVKQGQPAPLSYAEFWCWLNTWGDEDGHEATTRVWRSGYEAAIQDAFRHFGRIYGVAPHEDWMAWIRRNHDE